MDPMQIRLNEVLYRERLEAAAQARRLTTKPAGRSLIERVRDAIGARMPQPARPAPTTTRKLTQQ